MTTPVSEPALTSVLFRARALGAVQHFLLAIARLLRALVARREGRTSPLGAVLQLVGAGMLFYGLYLHSPAVAYIVMGLLALLAGEKL